MNNKYALKNVIKCIKTRKPFSSLAESKYTYGQIASTIVQAVKDGIIEYDDDYYVITAKGEEFYRDEIHTSEEEDYSRFIREDTLTIDDIFVPKYNKGDKKIEN